MVRKNKLSKVIYHMKTSSQKILLIGDSSLLPREELPYTKTYPYLLKALLSTSKIEMVGVSNNTSKKIALGIEPYTLYGFNPDTVILNYGIADVYPRPYPNWMDRLLACSGLQKYCDRFLKKTKLYYLLGDWFGYSSVPLDQFHTYSHDIVTQLFQQGVKKIIFVGIIRPSKILLYSKTVNQKIKLYNQIFQSLADSNKSIFYIDIYHDADETFSIWDGYHYSEIASDYLLQKISKLIND